MPVRGADSGGRGARRPVFEPEVLPAVFPGLTAADRSPLEALNPLVPIPICRPRGFGVRLVRGIEYRQLVTILSLFLIVQLAGVLIAFYFVSPTQVIQSATPIASSDLIFYFAYMVVAAAIMVFLFRVYHG